jgi:hypothetical protein
MGVETVIAGCLGFAFVVYAWIKRRQYFNETECPHCGAQWWSVNGFGEFFCYNCQRYWS